MVMLYHSCKGFSGQGCLGKQVPWNTTKSHDTRDLSGKTQNGGCLALVPTILFTCIILNQSLSICVCMCVCLCVCVDMSLFVSFLSLPLFNVCVHVSVCTYLCVCLYILLYLSISLLSLPLFSACIYVSVHMLVFVCLYISLSFFLSLSSPLLNARLRVSMCTCMCMSMYVLMFRFTCMFVVHTNAHVYIWMPEVDIMFLPPSVSTLRFETRSFLEPGTLIQLEWLVNKFIGSSCLCFLVLVL